MTTIKNNKKAGVGAAERRGGKKWIIRQPDKGKKVPVHTCVCACRVKVQTERQGARVTSLGKNIDVEHRCCRTSFAVAASSFFQIKKKNGSKRQNMRRCALIIRIRRRTTFFCVFCSLFATDADQSFLLSLLSQVNMIAIQLLSNKTTCMANRDALYIRLQ